jgi:hypothetical protein
MSPGPICPESPNRHLSIEGFAECGSSPRTAFRSSPISIGAQAGAVSNGISLDDIQGLPTPIRKTLDDVPPPPGRVRRFSSPSWLRSAQETILGELHIIQHTNALSLENGPRRLLVARMLFHRPEPGRPPHPHRRRGGVRHLRRDGFLLHVSRCAARILRSVDSVHETSSGGPLRRVVTNTLQPRS